MKLKSAKDFNLSPKYPLRLRKEHKFHPRSSTPTIKQKESLEFFDNFLSECQHSNNFKPKRKQLQSQKWTRFPSSTRPHPPKVSHQASKLVSNAHKSKGGVKKYHNFNAFKKPKGGTQCNFDQDRSKSFRHQRTNSSFCNHHKPSKSSRAKVVKPRYVPQGLTTVNDVPNMNLTSTQRKRIDEIASIFLNATQITNKLRSIAQDISQISPSTFRSAINSINNSYQFDVIWDSGASVCISPSKEDFLDYDTNVDIKNVAGVNGKSTSIIGQGTVGWSIFDVNGKLRHFELKAYHIPSSKARLISTSALLHRYRDETITIDGTCLRLSGIQDDEDRQAVTVLYNPMNKLPTSVAYLSEATKMTREALCNVVTTVSSGNNNLTEGQKELLRWHQRLGHLEFKKIQHLMRSGILSHTSRTRSLHTAAAKLKEFPKCAACLFGKQTTKTMPGKTMKIIQDRAGVLKSGNLLPGQEVSVDHFISSVKGRLFTGFNRGSIQDKYVGGCIFVDHASANIHVEFQSSLSSHETLGAKQAYENVCKDIGIVPQTYMSDNGTAFTSKEFVEHLSNFHQISKLAGVGAHHHNAQAERAIRTIMSIARTMMMHAGIHWPDVADPTLWPMAVKHSCFLYNHVPSHLSGLSPNDLFTKTRWPQKKFLDLHVWGCPVYVLDKSLQDGNKIPRWKPRSSRSVYVGISDSHASTVPLVLNISTGAITPQFHVVFDDWFATVPSESEDIPDFNSDDWNKMFGESRFQYILDKHEEDDEVEQVNEDIREVIKSTDKSDMISSKQEQSTSHEALIKEDPIPSEDDQNQSNQKVSLNPKIDKEFVPAQNDSVNSEEAELELINPDPLPQESPGTKKSSPRKSRTQNKPVVLGQRRSRRLRQRNAPQNYYESHVAKVNAYYLSLDYLDDNLVHAQSLLPFEHVMLSQKESNPDLFSYDQAMSSEHREKWMEAAEKEIRSLEGFDCWLEVPISQATTKVLPGTWVFKVKRAPDGSFKKFKARYCVRGDLQEGDFETYAPVVQFSSVRLFLAWSLLLDWYTCSVDFSNAFIQAKLKDDTFIHLPRGFTSSQRSKTCLKLKKSLYGLAVAPRLWYEHLWNSLKKQGLVQSDHDKCLLFRKDLIVICYVDDLGVQAPRKGIVDKFISNLKEDGLDLTVEGSFSEYLGIKYDKPDASTIKMTQEGLIQKIIEATKMEGCNPSSTPSTVEGLSSNEEGKRMTDTWNYRSVVGMMLYLSSNTRPDIAYAVSQVARFSHCPKQSHAEAVKMIVRYLSGTKSEGIIFKKPKILKLECYVDADYAGLYNRESPDNPTSVKSRTGYIISVGGCFVLCKSQLQSTIALSTSEAEYGALSHAMRAVIPVRETLLEMITKVDMINSKLRNPFGSRNELIKFPTVFYEDNSTALSLAINQKVTSRTKHWCVKFHFFWSYINEDNNNTKCERVSTDKQKADYLTKGLSKDKFLNCRHLNQGW